MVYGIIELINFAHGDVYMLGFLISLTFLGILSVNRTLGGWQLWIITFGVMFVTMLGTGTINMLIDRSATNRCVAPRAWLRSSLLSACPSCWRIWE